jgi:Uma2 family endonuclease
MPRTSALKKEAIDESPRAKTRSPVAKIGFTYADYKKKEFAPGERAELINGVYYMMAAPTDKHQAVLGELFKEIAVFLEDKPCKVRVAPYDVRLFYQADESDNVVVQPDIAVLCDEKKRGEEGCRGAPDLVVDILSPSNTAIEMKRKLDLYQRAGVREYWIVDPVTETVDVYRFKGGTAGLFTYQVFNASDKLVSVVLKGLKINLKAVFSA